MTNEEKNNNINLVGLSISLKVIYIVYLQLVINVQVNGLNSSEVLQSIGS